MSDESDPVYPSRYFASFMLLGATTFWGLSFPLAKGLYTYQLAAGVDSFSMSAFSLVVRFFSAAVVVALFQRSRLLHLTRREIKLGVGLGIFGGLGMLFQMDGLQHTSVSTSAFLTQLYCVLIPLLKTLMHRRLPSFRIVISIVLAVIGFAFFSGITPQNLSFGRGEIETAMCAVFFVGQILWLERPMFRRCDPWRATCLMFVLISALLLPGAFFGGLSAFHKLTDFYLHWQSWSMMAPLVLFCTVASYGMMNLFQPHIDSTEAGLIYAIEPVFATLAAMFLPALISAALGIAFANEFLTRNNLLGAMLIFAANLVIFLPFTGRPAPETKL